MDRERDYRLKVEERKERKRWREEGRERKEGTSWRRYRRFEGWRGF